MPARRAIKNAAGRIGSAGRLIVRTITGKRLEFERTRTLKLVRYAKTIAKYKTKNGMANTGGEGIKNFHNSFLSVIVSIFYQLT